MADEDTQAEDGPAEGEQQTPPLTVNAQYIKDLSFEVPGAPAVFSLLQDKSPNINVNIDVRAKPLDTNVFEVELEITANCSLEETTGFIAELVYGGILSLNVPDEHKQPLLLIECPRLLFPYARNILSDVTRDGGFPPLMLGPVDFVSMYQHQLEQQGETQDA